MCSILYTLYCTTVDPQNYEIESTKRLVTVKFPPYLLDVKHQGVEVCDLLLIQPFLMLSIRELRFVIFFSSNLCLMLSIMELRFVIFFSSNLCLMLSIKELRFVISCSSNLCLMLSIRELRFVIFFSSNLCWWILIA